VLSSPGTRDILQLFDTCVSSVLNYASEIWGFNSADAIERVHCTFLRSMLNVKTTTNKSALYGELGRLPLRHNRLVRIVKYWFKIRTCDNLMLSTMYKELLLQLEENNKDTYWLWMVRNTHNINAFIPIQRIKDNYITTWNRDIANSPKLELYRHIKEEFTMESYLDILKNAKHRTVLSKLTVSSHSLMI
jgi:hypothetical protein